jgi:5,6-dimethylbenzimidazole synthase
MTKKHAYSRSDIDAVYRAIRERRDVRHFQEGPLEPGQLKRFIAAAHAAPSVGLMQPWHIKLRTCILTFHEVIPSISPIA